MLAGFGLYELLHAVKQQNIATPMEDRHSRDFERLKCIIDSLVSPISGRGEAVNKINGLVKALPPVWEYSVEALGQCLLETNTLNDVLLSLYR
jgi:hypothetical protein